MYAAGPVTLEAGLVASQVSSPAGSGLTLAASGRVELVGDADGAAPAGLVLDGSGVAVTAPRLTAAHAGTPYLQADPDTFRVDAQQVVLAAPAGVAVAGTVQAAAFTSLPAGDLTLEALAQSLTLTAGGDASLASTAGSVTVSAPLGITLRASAPAASIYLDAAAVRVASLAAPGGGGGAAAAARVCVCADSGRLFSVDAATACAAAAVASCP